jgi:hypothetical protein
MIGSPNANEPVTAFGKLKEFLAAHGLTWNDIPAMLSDTGISFGYVMPREPASPYSTE